MAPITDRPRANRTRLVAGVVVIVGVAVATVFAVRKQRKAFVDAFAHLGTGTLVLSLLFAIVGVALTFPVWRDVLAGLGVELPAREGSRVFFTSQLGKYLPGAVWPAVLQMEAGRGHGASRRTMLAANLITLTMGCATGLLVAVVLLPLYDVHTLHKYWYVLLALPPLLALLHPRTIPWLLDKLFVMVRREPLERHVSMRDSLQASAWNTLSWCFLGLSIGVLAVRLDGFHIATFVLCTGAVSLAVVAGVLFVPAPAGFGARDVILQVVLVATLSSGQALAVVVASRAVLVATDVLLALVVVLVPRSNKKAVIADWALPSAEPEA